MTIELIDDKHLIIALSEEDMKTFSITFKQLDWNNDFFKKVISELLALAKKEADFFTDNQKMTIEMLPQNGGYVIFITVISKTPKRKIYKIKSIFGPYIFIFKNIDNVISAVDKINKKNIPQYQNQLIEYQGSYYLVLYPIASLPTCIKLIFSEYGKIYGNGKLKSARINELGDTLIKENAIKTISHYFCHSKEKTLRP